MCCAVVAKGRENGNLHWCVLGRGDAAQNDSGSDSGQSKRPQKEIVILVLYASAVSLFCKNEQPDYNYKC